MNRKRTPLDRTFNIEVADEEHQQEQTSINAIEMSFGERISFNKQFVSFYSSF